MSKNYLAEDVKPKNYLAGDTRPKNSIFFESKPKGSLDASFLDTTQIVRTLGGGMWMGSPFLTYPDDINVIP